MHFKVKDLRGDYRISAQNSARKPCKQCRNGVLYIKNRVNNSLHLWSEDILLVEEWISLDSNSSRVKIHYPTSGISPGFLDIHSKRSDHWGHSPGSDVSDKKSENSLLFLESSLL